MVTVALSGKGNCCGCRIGVRGSFPCLYSCTVCLFYILRKLFKEKKFFVNAFEVGNTYYKCVIPALDEHNIGRGLHQQIHREEDTSIWEKGQMREFPRWLGMS